MSMDIPLPEAVCEECGYHVNINPYPVEGREHEFIMLCRGCYLLQMGDK